MSIKKIDENLCNGCTLCESACPMDVIRMDKEKRTAFPAYIEDCGLCFLCEEVCPVNAIDVSPSPSASREWFLPY